MSYIYKEKSWWENFYDYFRREETVENRTAAVHAYLPKWKGFLASGAGHEMNATEAFVELRKVADGLTNTWIKEGGLTPEKMHPAYFNINTVK